MKTRAKVKFTYCIFFMLLYNISSAQISQPRTFEFKRGDEFQKETSINSTCTIQRGNQKLTVNSTSSVTKLYKVTAVTGTNYEFRVSIQKMDDSLSALRQKLHYNSGTPIDPTSRIEKALDYMMNKSVTVKVDRNGIILSKDISPEFANDTLLAFTGIQPELFIEGKTFGLLANFKSDKLKKGKTWTNKPTGTDKQKAVTKYTVYTVSDTTTVIRFTSTVTDRSVNSNTNGTYVLDNKSGLVKERFIQSLSAGYAVIGKTIFVTTRSSSIHETCGKNPSNNAFAQNRQ